MIHIYLSRNEADGLVGDIADAIDNSETRLEFLEELLTSLDFRLYAE